MASGFTDTGATLTITGHTGDWHYKADHGPDATCSSSAVTTTTKNLTGLTAATTYKYSAYSKSGCATADMLVRDSAFTTDGVSVSNLAETVMSICQVSSGSNCATGFTTGKSANGYTLHSITTDFNLGQATPTDLTVALYTESSGKPAATAVSNATFTLTSTVSRGGVKYAYTHTCARMGCDLAANTDYFIVLSASTISYLWETTASVAETKVPSNNGWSIADNQLRGANWSISVNQPGKMRLITTVKRTLSVTNLRGTTATLNIVKYDGTAWWYKRTAPTGDSTCHSVNAGTKSVTLSSLTAGATYTYKAYDKSGCNSADKFDSHTFTLGTLAVSSVEATTATLTPPRTWHALPRRRHPPST